jgi:hypothetical protein
VLAFARGRQEARIRRRALDAGLDRVRYRGSGNTRKIAYDLAGLAHVAALEHKPRDALVYLGAAQALRDATGGPQLPPNRPSCTACPAPAPPPLARSPLTG